MKAVMTNTQGERKKYDVPESDPSVVCVPSVFGVTPIKAITVQKFTLASLTVQFGLAAVVTGILSHIASGFVRDALLMMDGFSIAMFIVAGFDFLSQRKR